jgi:condensation domain-containing protein
LDAGPLVRIGVHRRADDAVLLLAAHHIVTDFWSMAVLADDIARHYAAYAEGREITVPAPAATYADFLAFQRELLADKVAAGWLTRYWDDQVGDRVPPLALPGADEDAPAGARSFSLSERLTTRLRERAARERVTLFVVLLTAFETLLHNETGTADLAVGTSVAARTRPEFADVVGCCTNPVLIRSHAAGTVRDLLAATRDRVAGALEHQDYPTALLAARHRPRGRGRSLFDALFTFNRAPVPGEDLAAVMALGPAGVQRRLGPLRVESFPLPQAEGALALELMMVEAAGELHGLLRHRAGSFTAPAAARLVDRFTAVLAAVADDPELPVEDVLPKAEAGRAG